MHRWLQWIFYLSLVLIDYVGCLLYTSSKDYTDLLLLFSFFSSFFFIWLFVCCCFSKINKNGTEIIVEHFTRTQMTDTKLCLPCPHKEKRRDKIIIPHHDPAPHLIRMEIYISISSTQTYLEINWFLLLLVFLLVEIEKGRGGRDWSYCLSLCIS